LIEIVKNWFQKHFSDPQVAILALLLIVGVVVVLTMGEILAPVIAGAIIAYLLEGLVGVLVRRRVNRLLAVVAVFLLFIAALMFIIFGLVPLIAGQATQLIQELPNILSKGQEALLKLPQNYPTFFTTQQVTDLTASIRGEIVSWGQQVVQVSIASLTSVVTWGVYLVIIPLLVFFFLKDKTIVADWFNSYLPRERKLATQVWREMDLQIANYVRGKFWEICIVGVATYAVLYYTGLQFALLLGLLVGLSVIIPYVGAVVVTIPVVVIAYFQFGFSADFAWVLALYLIVQGLDGNLLVPLLFSEVVNLHPIAIIVALLVFGGLWGFWGFFFAIPLATLVNAVLHAWPRDGTALFPKQENA
jgi:putative permease